MTHFIKTKIKHHKTLENGKQKTITETYIFRAESFTEAETRAVQYANDFAFTEFAVTALTNCRCTEIVRQTNFEQSVPLWFRAKLDYITLDERTARERHTKLNVLVEASCFEHANDIVAKYIADSVADIRLLSLTATTRTDDNNGNIIYGTGLAIEIPTGCVGLIFPRSSIRKTSLFQANGVSVIDSGYRGEITVTMRKYINPDTKEYNPDAQYQPGERIAQLIVMPYPPCRIAEMNELSTSERGTKGYGSTGK